MGGMDKMASVNNDLPAHIVAVSGTSGSGKSIFLKSRIGNEPRLVIFDRKDEWSRVDGIPPIARVTDPYELIHSMREAGRGGNLRVAFRPIGDEKQQGEQLDLFCRGLLNFGYAAVVIEELSGVTTPSKAPYGWGEVLRTGRALGLKVYGVSQRPSESDKTIMGNRSELHVCPMERDQDMVYMAKELNVHPDEVRNLVHIDKRHAENGQGIHEFIHKSHKGLQKGRILTNSNGFKEEMLKGWEPRKMGG